MRVCCLIYLGNPSLMEGWRPPLWGYTSGLGISVYLRILKVGLRPDHGSGA